MYGTVRATTFGYSLWEFEVYGSGGLPLTPPLPTPTLGPSVTPKPLQPSQWDSQINSLMSQLTLAEKISMIAGDTGGFSTPPITRLGIPALIMSDGPHGIRGGTLWPALSGAANSFDSALEQQVGVAMAKEFRALGKNVSLGPMLNLVRDGRWGRANETYSEDPFLSGKLAAARIRGIQTVGVIARRRQTQRAGVGRIDVRFLTGVPSPRRRFVADHVVGEPEVPAIHGSGSPRRHRRIRACRASFVDSPMTAFGERRECLARPKIAKQAALQQGALQGGELPAAVAPVDLGDIDQLDGRAHTTSAKESRSRSNTL